MAKARPRPQPKAKAQVLAKPKAQAKAGARAQAERVLRRYEAEGLRFRSVEGVMVVEVKALLTKAGKDNSNASKWSAKAKETHGWSDQQLFQQDRTYVTSNRGRTRRKLGGSQP